MSARVSLDRQTVLNACAAGAILALGISAFALLTLDDGVWRAPRTPASYMAGGLEASGTRVSQELGRQFAPGAPMPRVLGWLQHQGFHCEPQMQTGSYLCLYRRSLAWNQAAELRVVLRADGHHYRSAEARVDLRPDASRLR